MSERAKKKDAEIIKIENHIVRNCPKCKGSGINTKEAMKIEMAVSENALTSRSLSEQEGMVFELKKERKKKYIRRHDENPKNSSYGFCTCYIEFEFLKGLLIGEIPFKFKDTKYKDILPRDILIEDKKEKDPLVDFTKKYVKKFHKFKKDSMGINLFGKIGTGRTFIAQLIGSKILKKRYSVHYIPYFVLAKMLLTFDDREMLNEILNVDLLIIDEIGLEHPSKQGFGGEIAYSIQKRIQSRKTTIFGYNGMPDYHSSEISEVYGGSFASVMYERNINVKFIKKALGKKTRTNHIKKALDEL
jgi:DNA replication protein DnaC